MKKIIGISILSFFILINPAYSNKKIINSLKEGGKIIFIRHALAPGNGDPEKFNLKDCSTQRNLNYEGINQSKKIGLFFYINNIEINNVLSSEWCRCKDTAKYAFKNYKTFSALNSFYNLKFTKNKNRQIRNLKKYISNWDGKKNLILVTHFVVIYEVLNIETSSGEIIITDKNLSIIGNLKVN